MEQSLKLHPVSKSSTPLHAGKPRCQNKFLAVQYTKLSVPGDFVGFMGEPRFSPSLSGRLSIDTATGVRRDRSRVTGASFERRVLEVGVRFWVARALAVFRG